MIHLVLEQKLTTPESNSTPTENKYIKKKKKRSGVCVYIYTYVCAKENYSATKRNKIGVLCRNMDLELSYRVKSVQKDKRKYHILILIWGIQKNDTEEPIFRAGIELQM